MQMVNLYKDPEGKHVFDNDRNNHHDTSTVGTNGTMVSNREQKGPIIQQLESKVVALEKVLRDYQVSHSRGASSLYVHFY